MTRYRRAGGPAAFAVAGAVAVAIFSAAGASHAAGLRNRGGSGERGTSHRSNAPGAQSAQDNSTASASIAIRGSASRSWPL